MDFRKLIPSYKTQLDCEYQYTFTVFTPTYNSAKTLERVHNSLVRQTFKDFEWLVINDGSTDNTTDIMAIIRQDSPLQINYVNNKKNKHKMATFMESVKLAKGKFLLTFDADDECVPEALQIFNDEYMSIPERLKPKVAAVTGLCINQHGTEIGQRFPSEPYFSNTFKTYAIDQISGEKWGFTKTDVLKGLVYEDEFVNSGFLQEGIIWNLLAKEDFITKYINKIVRIYHVDIEDSISSAPKQNNALGGVVQHIVNFNWFFNDHFLKTPIYFLKNLYFLLRNASYLNLSLKDYLKAIDSVLVRIVLIILWPFRKLFKV